MYISGFSCHWIGHNQEVHGDEEAEPLGLVRISRPLALELWKKQAHGRNRSADTLLAVCQMDLSGSTSGGISGTMIFVDSSDMIEPMITHSTDAGAGAVRLPHSLTMLTLKS
jgi:hypothetical protein